MKNWFKSVAGRISIGLFIISAILVIIACSNLKSWSSLAANNTNTILIGIATNFLGIIVMISFVQFFLDRQKEKEECQKEADMIRRYNRFMRILIQRYLMFFICVTVPIEDRTKKEELQYNKNFQFQDMRDMYRQSLYVNENLFEPSVSLWYKSEAELRSYMIKMLENIDFKYNKELEAILLTFVELSKENDVRGAVLGSVSTMSGMEKQSEIISRYIQENPNDWLDKYDNGQLGANIMRPVVELYYLLKKEIIIIEEYMDYVSSLNEGLCRT